MQSRALIGLLIFGSVLGCGSRTGLDLLEVDDDLGTDGGLECTVRGDRLAPLEQRVPEVLFVIDASGSMTFGLDGNEMPEGDDRWTILGRALLSAVSVRSEELSFGAVVYPDSPTFADGCNMRSAPLLSMGDRRNGLFLERLFERWMPDGGTPTAAALHLARENVKDPPPNVQRFVILATDGAPNCNPSPPRPTPDCVCTRSGWCGLPEDAVNCLDDVDPVEAVRAITDEEGVPVYVVGLLDTGLGYPASEFRRVLDAMAEAGRRPQRDAPTLYYDATQPGALDRILGEIVGGLTRCVYYLSGALAVDDVVAVRVGDTTLTRDDTGIDGWSVSNPSAGEITLHGSACALAEDAGQLPTAVGECP